MQIPRLSNASHLEIERLKQLVKKIDQEDRIAKKAKLDQVEHVVSTPQTPPSPSNTTPPSTPNQAFSNLIRSQERVSGPLFNGGIRNVQITREPIICDNPVLWLKMLMPNFKPYKWQFETLMQVAGYLTPGKYDPLKDKTPITDQNPFLFVGPMANGSGKDMVLIAAASTWLAVTGARNRVIITSSSFDQTKTQTEPHIRELISLANRKYGTLFKSIQFHHVVPELGSEIKLFATDEAGKAEGFHPFADGKMMIIINEAKSVTEAINDSLLRCTGYSHRLEISSPGPRSGFMFKHVDGAVLYPNPAILGRYYFRRVTAFDCPHITKAHIDLVAHEKGIDSPWYKSSILAEFSDIDTTVVITEYEYNLCSLNPPANADDDIGIGLDLAAGGDEDACFVRLGNHVVHSFFFRNPNTDIAADLIDKQLLPWKFGSYVFRADNGGIGLAIIDKLQKLGWRVRRTNNQSPAYNKREFLNLGAEQWFHTKRLIARRDIIIPVIAKLKEQLTTRWYRGFDSTQGKYALESKQEARASGRPSPDRADAFVLCFASYHPARKDKPIETGRYKQELVTPIELLRRANTGVFWQTQRDKPRGRFTLLNGKI